MKILLLNQVLPYPPDSGSKIKTWHAMRLLAREHEVTLLSFIRDDEARYQTQLEQVFETVRLVPIKRTMLEDVGYLARSIVTRQPFFMLRDDRQNFQTELDALLEWETYDVVYADQLNMAQYACRVPAECHILDNHNALWLLYERLSRTMPHGPKRWLLQHEAHLLRSYEGDMCQRFDHVFAVSEEDRLALQEVAGNSAAIDVMPIGVDLELWPVVKRNQSANHITHVGTMYWPPNVDAVDWFFGDVLDLVREQHPTTVIDLIGKQPPEHLRKKAESLPHVNMRGYVEDTLPYLQQTAVFIVPLRAGGGMRVKILQALAQGLPLVTTSLGCEGIRVQDGVHCLIADDAISFAAAVSRLLDNPALGAELASNGRKLLEMSYDVAKTLQPLQRALNVANS